MTGPPLRRIAYGLFVLAATVVLALWPILNHDAYKQNVILLAFLIAVIAVGWNIISGFAAYVSLRHSALAAPGTTPQRHQPPRPAAPPLAPPRRPPIHTTASTQHHGRQPRPTAT